jgi:hypothetical protein
MLNFSISYSDFIKFPYFADTTVRGDWGESTEDEDRVTSQISPMKEQRTSNIYFVAIITSIAIIWK